MLSPVSILPTMFHTNSLLNTTSIGWPSGRSSSGCRGALDRKLLSHCFQSSKVERGARMYTTDPLHCRDMT
jgi:hypothetical protein